jgi:hypothetical protein
MLVPSRSTGRSPPVSGLLGSIRRAPNQPGRCRGHKPAGLTLELSDVGAIRPFEVLRRNFGNPPYVVSHGQSGERLESTRSCHSSDELDEVRPGNCHSVTAGGGTRGPFGVLGLGRMKTMPTHQPQQHLVAEALPAYSDSSVDHCVGLVWPQVAALNLRSLA